MGNYRRAYRLVRLEVEQCRPGRYGTIAVRGKNDYGGGTMISLVSVYEVRRRISPVRRTMRRPASGPDLGLFPERLPALSGGARYKVTCPSRH
jgi:hypothetical protein